MLDLINTGILSVMDLLLGWVLHLPMDVVLLIVAVGTGALLTVARIFTTDQDLLRRCSDDRKRLKELLKKAKRAKDADAVGRHRMTLRLVASKAAASEWRPLLLAILPLAFLGTWAWQRIAYVPPRADEPLRVILYLPVSAEGEVVHVVPMDGVETEGGWVQRAAVVASDEGPPDTLAVWTLRAKAASDPYDLSFRYRGKTYRHPLLVGHRTYAGPIIFHDSPDVICSKVDLPEAKLLGLVPGIRWLAVQPWLVAYFLIAIPSVMLLKRVLGIY